MKRFSLSFLDSLWKCPNSQVQFKNDLGQGPGPVQELHGEAWRAERDICAIREGVGASLMRSDSGNGVASEGLIAS